VGTAVERNDADAVLGLGQQDNVVPVLDDFDRKGRDEQTRHSMGMAVPRRVPFTMHMIVVRLFKSGGQIGQFPVGRIHDHGLAARLVIIRLLPLDIERRYNLGVAPDALQVRMPIGLPRGFELRGLSERGQRDQK
jgi:hypothetical protein